MFHVQISVGNGRHPWRDVAVDPVHVTLDGAIARITSTGRAASWVRVVDAAGAVVVRFADGRMIGGEAAA